MPTSDPPPSLHPALAELSGTVLESRYRLGRVLGAGGMGAVFEATHLRLDRRVAIKVLRPVFVGDEEFIKRFLREAKAASKIRHRNVVEILDFGEAAGGLIYSVMEFLEGQDLDHLLRTQPGRRLPWAQACSFLVQIASGLKAAHACGVIHRDIKPANCFLTQEDDEPLLKVVDFGIAKVDEADQSQQLTGTAQVLGTPSYIAPELVRTQSPASPRSDIYSLGVLAYRMLTGQLPFAGETVFEVLRRSCFDPVPSLRDRVPELSPAVESFVLTLLAKQPEERPSDMLAVRERLLVLGRETLSPKAVESATSAPLALDPPASAGTRESSEVPTLRRTIVAPATGLATVRLGGLPKAPEAPPPEEPPEQATVVAFDPPSAPQHAIGEDTPAPISDPSTVPNVTASELPRPGRRGGWLVLGSVAAVLGVGGWAVSLVLQEQNLEGAPALSAAASAPELRAPSSSPAPVPSADPAATVPAKPLSLNPPPAIETAADEPDSPSRAEPTEAEPSAPVVEPEPTPVSDHSTPRPADPTPEPEARTNEPIAEPTPRRTKTVRPKRKPKPLPPAGLPSDDVIEQRIETKIRSKCADLLSSEGVTIRFLIKPNGEIGVLSSEPPNGVGACARAQVNGTKFQPRPDLTARELSFK